MSMYIHYATKTITDGGATFDPRTGEEITEGYAVAGIAEAVRVPVDEFDPDVLADAVTDFPEHAVIGTWHDTETGIIWIEPSEVYPFEAWAAAVAAERGEIAYFDLTHGVEVRMDEVAA